MAAAADARSFWHLFKLKIENVYTTKKQRLIRNQMLFFEADSRTRTDDLRITNASLYQLSHIGVPDRYLYSIHGFGNNCKMFF